MDDLFEFSRNKYHKELLIDCFLKSETLDIEQPTDPFLTNFYELIFITKGSGVFMLNDERIEFQPGTVLFLPPHQWQQWLKFNGAWDAVYLMFEEEYISTFFNDPLYLYRFHYFYNKDSPSYILLDPVELEKYTIKLIEIQEEIKNLQSDSAHLLRSLLYYLLITLNRRYEEIHKLAKSFYKEALVMTFRKLLEDNIKVKQRVSEYAELMEVSSSHLNKLLKSYFGKSCSEIIKERLVLEVKKLLLFSNQSISEVSYELGFSEVSNFTRFCHQYLKMTPKEFRNQNDKS